MAKHDGDSIQIVTIDNLPITEITQDNCASEWNNLLDHIHGSSFVALDIVSL